MPSTAHICPRQTFARGCPSAHGGQYDHGSSAARTSPSGQTPADARRFCRSAGRTGLENLRGGWLCTHPHFQNTMCKSHKLHCFSKPLLEKALTARRRRVIVTGARARPKAFTLPSGFFAPFFSRPFVMQPFVRRPTGRRARFDEGQSAFLRRPSRRRLPPPHRKCGRGRFHVLHTLHTFILSILSILSIFLILSIPIRRPCR